jgi:hypothetical protein
MLRIKQIKSERKEEKEQEIGKSHEHRLFHRRHSPAVFYAAPSAEEKEVKKNGCVIL